MQRACNESSLYMLVVKYIYIVVPIEVEKQLLGHWCSKVNHYHRCHFGSMSRKNMEKNTSLNGIWLLRRFSKM
jgi:hypothetical protein